MAALALLSLSACARRVDNAVAGSRLEIRSAVLPSGEETALTLWDNELRAGCAFMRVGGAYRCVPVGASIVYRDANCTQAIALERRAERCASALGDERYASEMRMDDCAQDVRVFRLGPATPSPPTLFAKSVDGSCSARGGAALGDVTYELGLPVAASELVSATARDLTQRTRLGFAQSLVTNDGARIDGLTLGGVLFDRELGTACTPERSDDGFPRCLPFPTETPAASHYADARCSAPLLRIARNACQAPAPRFASRAETEACNPKTTVYSVSAELEDVYAPSFDAATCELQPVDPEVASYALAPLAASDFAELSLAPSLADQRLTSRHWVAASGERARFEDIFDSLTGLGCRVTLFADNDARCVPGQDPTAFLAFSDDDCREPVVVRHTRCTSGDISPYVLQVGGDASATCPSLNVFRAGAKIDTPSALFADESGICAPIPVAPSHEFFAAEPVTIDTFARVSIKTQ